MRWRRGCEVTYMLKCSNFEIFVLAVACYFWSYCSKTASFEGASADMDCRVWRLGQYLDPGVWISIRLMVEGTTPTQLEKG